MEDITVTIENEDTTEVTLTEATTVLVREYVGGKNIEIEDNVINCTYKYQLPANVVTDSKYVHTDNNYTTAEKEKLASLENADLSDFYTKGQTDQIIAESHDNYYTKQETRTMILQDLESYYTREETDNKLEETSNSTKEATLTEVAENYYNKTEIEESYYNKTEVDNLMLSGEASGITIEDASGYFSSDNVEGALQEIGASLAGVVAAVSTQSEVVS